MTDSNVHALVKYEAACRAVSEARSVDEAKEIRDKSEAMRAYARQAKNKELEVNAAEIRFRAERRIGELIEAQKTKGPGLAKGGQPYQSTGSGTDPVQKPPTLKEAGIDKHLADRARKLAKLPEKKFEGILGDWRDRVAKENERVTVRLLREDERAERDETLKSKPIVWPSDKYAVIYADPPWRYDHLPKTSSREIENQYPTMSLEEICALPVMDIAADDAVLFMWATSPKLAESFQVLSAWGFEYRTSMCWVKDRIGMGFYVRSQHEMLLIAKRGEPAMPAEAVRPSSVIHAPRTRHSAKPAEFAAAIEAMYPDWPKVELFSRSPRDGWAAWGNQANAA